jgi:pimeloyl-ACP methyl ester carboxylesterase
MMSTGMKRVVSTAAALALAAGALQLGGSVATAKSATFSPRAEAAKMDAIPTPRLDWYSCFQTAECATAKVPRDYDSPAGAQVELALLRVKARDQKKRIGSLFVNPGGPGGSATAIAYFSRELFPQEITDRFDIVGLDPRGIAFSDNVQCFPSPRQLEEALSGYQTFFPTTAAQEKAWLASDKKVGGACSKDPLATSMSTAEVARDMELMRRAVKDPQLSYLGFSYGSYLGQVYANMFPDRFRAVVVDGVLDPVAWAGDSANQGQPLEARLRASAGAWKALREILVRCDRVGGGACSFAIGDPLANLDLIAQRLKAKPLTDTDPFTGETYLFGYSDMVGSLLVSLYDPAGYQQLTDLLTQLLVLTEPPATQVDRAAAAARTAAEERFAELRRQLEEQAQRPPLGFPYFNGLDALASVTCTDSDEKTRGASYPEYADQADERAPYFGRSWLWSSSTCAGDGFTGEDEDAYRGPFTTRTKAPVLIVGNYWDPATNYQGAVGAAAKLPNSRLLSSDSFGHTAYGSSGCVTTAVDAYLLKATLPKAGTVCKGDIQPFAPDTQPADLAANRVRQQAMHQRLTPESVGMGR